MAQPLSAVLVCYMFRLESELTQQPGYSASGLSYMQPMSNNEVKKLERSSIPILLRMDDTFSQFEMTQKED